MKLFLTLILLLNLALFPNFIFSSPILFNKLFRQFFERILVSDKSTLLNFILLVSMLSRTVSCKSKYLDSIIDFITSSEIGIILLVPLILFGAGAQLVKKGSISVLFISIKTDMAESLKNLRSFFILNKYLESKEYSGFMLYILNFPEFE